jgi:hypothetical protein
MGGVSGGSEDMYSKHHPPCTSRSEVSRRFNSLRVIVLSNIKIMEFQTVNFLRNALQLWEGLRRDGVYKDYA